MGGYGADLLETSRVIASNRPSGPLRMVSVGCSGATERLSTPIRCIIPSTVQLRAPLAPNRKETAVEPPAVERHW